MPGINHLIDNLVVRAAAGPLHRFQFAPGKGFRGRDVEKILLDHGIAIYERRRDPSGELSFGVRHAHAEWAEYLLCRAGVPLTSPLLNEAHADLLEEEGPDDRPLVTRLLDALLRIAD
jgi:hypothetical protein